MSPSEIAYAAADYLRVFGWRQGGTVPRSPCRCAIGALWMVAAHEGHLAEAGYAVRERMARLLDVGSIAVWNDAPGRTADEVIATFVRTAQSLEVEEA